MADTVTQPESTTPVEQAAPSVGLHEMDRAQRDKFFETGEVPASKPSDESAASSTAEAAEQPAEIAAKEAAPASETGKPGDKKTARNAEENRVKELLADRRREAERADRAERMLDELRAGKAEKPKADVRDSSTSGETAKERWRRLKEHPDAPKQADYAGDLDEYTAQMAEFVAREVSREEMTAMLDSRDKAGAESYERDRTFAANVDAFETAAKAELEADPEILGRIPDRWKALNPPDRLVPGEQLTKAHFVKDRATFHSRNPLRLSELLTANGEAELRRIAPMPTDLIIRELAYLDAGLSASPGVSTTTAAAKPAKTFTKTPAPPTNLGTKPAGVGDPLQKAVEAGDYHAFDRLLTEAEAARR